MRINILTFLGDLFQLFQFQVTFDNRFEAKLVERAAQRLLVHLAALPRLDAGHLEVLLIEDHEIALLGFQSGVESDGINVIKI